MSFRILHAYKGYKPDPTGGVAEVIETLVSASNADVEHSILVARTQGRARKYRHNGVAVQAVPSLGTLSSMPVAPTYPFTLAQSLKSTDLLMHHAPYPLTDVGLLMPHPGHLRLVVHWHAELVRSSILVSLITPLLRHSLERADRIVVAHESSITNSALLRQYDYKCVTVPYSVDVEYWSQLDAAQRAKAAELRDRFPRLIVSIGRLVPYKGFAVLLDAMQKVDGNLIIVGAGPLDQSLQAHARRLGLQNRVLFAGYQAQEDIKTILHAAQAFAFPSVSSAEAFGIAQLEAMAVGLPVVNTALPTAVPHISRHGIEGLTVPVDDRDALAKALSALLDDPSMARGFGDAGRRRVDERFNRQSFLARMNAVYHDMRV